MTQKNKELLLKDLSARLPYGVKCKYNCVVQVETFVAGKHNFIGELNGIVPLHNGHIGFMVDCDKVDALEGDIKPYLRPLSSMTEEEREDFYQNVLDMDIEDVRYENDGKLPLPYNQKDKFIWFENLYLDNTFAVIDWLNAHHFDYRGLIPMGLAIKVTEKNNPYETGKLYME